MTRRSSRPRRSGTELAVRGVLAVMAAGGGIASRSHKLAYMNRGSDSRHDQMLAG